MKQKPPADGRNNTASRKKQSQQDALNVFLVAADSLAKQGNLIEAELRYKDAMKTAERQFGGDSDQYMLVSSILAAFYRVQGRMDEAEMLEARLFAWSMPAVAPPQPEDPLAQGQLGAAFVERKKSQELTLPQTGDNAKISVPRQHRKACQILGLPFEDGITAADVNRAWKQQMLNTSAHPDLGGNTDEAVLLNQAKEELLNYIQSRQPKLGNLFKK